MTQLLCAYTLVLALAGWIVIRAGRVWEDARIILLVVLLMFTALSTSYDNLCLKNPAAGAIHLAIGFGFCCAITEFILFSLGMKLPLPYRAPFYLQLALLFAFPALLGKLSVYGQDAAMCVGVLSFPVAAAAGLLTLLPAAIGQPERENGTPWPWPYYPWSIFVFVAIASGIRAWMLSVSFSPAAGVEPAFLPYFLCPILLAMLILVLELGLRMHSRRAQRIALLAMLGVIWMAFPGERLNSAQRLLLDLLENSLAGPPVLVSAAVAAVAVYAMLRRAAGSELVTIVALGLLACLDVNTRSIESISSPNILLWFALAVWQINFGLWTRNMLRLAFGGIVIIVFFGKTLNAQWMFEHNAYWAIQLSVIWCALLPLVCRDKIANHLRAAGPFWIASTETCLVAFHPDFWSGVPNWAPAFVASMMTLVSLSYWLIFRVRWYLLAAGWIAALASLFWTNAALRMLGDVQLRHGLTWYAAGYAVLAGGLLVSLWKARSIQRGWAWLQHHAELPPHGGASA
jgi:hypothetical protein